MQDIDSFLLHIQKEADKLTPKILELLIYKIEDAEKANDLDKLANIRYCRNVYVGLKTLRNKIFKKNIYYFYEHQTQDTFYKNADIWCNSDSKKNKFTTLDILNTKINQARIKYYESIGKPGSVIASYERDRKYRNYKH